MAIPALLQTHVVLGQSDIYVPVFGHIRYDDWLWLQGWQKSGKYSYFPGRREILGNKIDS
jgi:hypothetical protein